MNRLRSLAALLSLCWLSACVEDIRPHQPAAGDTYCVYKVTKSKGGGAIPVGGIICIYCKPGGPQDCKKTRKVSPAKGMEYDLVNLDNSCTDCREGGKTYELAGN